MMRTDIDFDPIQNIFMDDVEETENIHYEHVEPVQVPRPHANFFD